MFYHMITKKMFCAGVIDALLDTMGDKNSLVVETVSASLHKISERHCNDVLNASCSYCKQRPKMNKSMLGEILQLIERVCQDYTVSIDGDTLMGLIEFAIDTMTQSTGYDPVIQWPASAVLVRLGRKHPIQVNIYYIESLFLYKICMIESVTKINFNCCGDIYEQGSNEKLTLFVYSI